ncbi:MAG: hypothetical protein GXP46_12310 [Deferribacteres bacterium]|nr:hypothetical protein [Deferribacteres bacterium]
MSRKRRRLTSLKDLAEFKDRMKPNNGPDLMKGAAPVHETEPGGAAGQEAARETVQEEDHAVTRKSQAWYDGKLGSETEDAHNPNPYDYVFFSDEGPSLYSYAQLDGLGPLQSGYINVTLKTLTPLHIVGKQVPAGRPGRKIDKSFFYRQGNSPCVPGSSMRGMLRAFVEAVTNGWVSQATEVYEQERSGARKKRHIEFKSFERAEHAHGCIGGIVHRIGPVIPSGYRPDLSSGKLDIATYLFGHVDSREGGGSGNALAGRLCVEDALIQDSLTDSTMIDTNGPAFMGGPAPRANWWHMHPAELWDRNVAARSVVQIVGDGFWGRKFYYHQAPDKCIQEYRNSRQWSNLYNYRIETLSGRTENFRIYFDRVPLPLVVLLCTCLSLPGTMRHKLGYGKAFGYGSVEFSISSVMMREHRSADWPGELADRKDEIDRYISEGWQYEGFESLIDPGALLKLSWILAWKPDDDITFTYPPYSRGNFMQVVSKSDMPWFRLSSPRTPVTEEEALDAARRLWDTKKPVLFPLYQARAKGYGKIKRRQP